MGDENPIRTLEDYSKPSYEDYRNPIELPEGNTMVPLGTSSSDTIRYWWHKRISYLQEDEEEKSDKDDVATDNGIKKINSSNAEMPVKEVETKNGAENRIKNEPIKRDEKEEVVEAPNSQPV
ncbi:hypothetical protein Tco_0805280 [Tanacetum coccineum]